MANFELKLYTLAPVHIGSGVEANAKEYIYEHNKYYFPDMGKLYLYLMNNHSELLDEYETFLLDSGNKTNRRNARLTDFLTQFGITNRDFGGFYINRNEMDDGSPDRLNSIQLFNRNGLGERYIPGSSLKGALRTIIENVIFKEKYDHQTPMMGQEYNDLFHNIRVYDSEPLEDKDFILAGKYDYGKYPKKIGVLQRESLRPECVIKFKIETRGQEATDVIEHLIEHSKDYYQLYKDFFLLDGNFEAKYIQKNLSDQLGILYLGAGAGIWTKTVMRKVDLAKIQRKYARTKTKMKGKGVMKLTKSIGDERLINNREHLFEMGKCNFDIKRLPSS